MTRSIAQRSKRHSKTQIQSQQKATLVRWDNKHIEKKGLTFTTIRDLKYQLFNCQQQVKDQKRKYWNERRRNYRLQKAHAAQRLNLKNVTKQARRLRGTLQTLQKDFEEIQRTADGSICLLQARVKELETAKKDLTQTRAVLQKRNTHIL